MSDHKGARLILDALPPAKALLADRGYDSFSSRAAVLSHHEVTTAKFTALFEAAYLRQAGPPETTGAQAPLSID